MPVKYKLIERSTGLHQKGNSRYYAQIQYATTVTYDELCELIESKSSLNSTLIKYAVNCLCDAIRRELKDGKIVQVGELGNFRLSLSSTGAERPDDFSSQKNIRDVHILHLPGKGLRIKDVEFKRSY